MLSTNVPLGSTPINLANDNGITNASLGDGNGNSYINVGGLTIPFEDNVTSFSPFTYVPMTTPNDDGIVTVTGTNLPPVASGYSYTITTCESAVDPALTLSAATGLLVSDTDPQGFPLTVDNVNGSPANLGTPITLASGARAASQLRRLAGVHAASHGLHRHGHLHLHGQ